MTFPISVEARGLDGGPTPIQIVAFVDGSRWPVSLSQDGGEVVEPTAGADGVATFDVSIPSPGSQGAHDLVFVTVRKRPQNTLGSAWNWIVGSTAPRHGATGSPAEVTQVARTGFGSYLRAVDGTIVMKPNRILPDAGTFSWTAHLEDLDSFGVKTRCPTSVERFRLFALVDSEPWRFANGEDHLDFEFSPGTAVEGQVELSGLPSDDGHAVTILLQRNPGRYGERPDGSFGPWWDGVVLEVGSTWW